MENNNEPTKSFKDSIRNEYVSPKQIKTAYNEICSLIKTKLDEAQVTSTMATIFLNRAKEQIRKSANNNSFIVKKRRKAINGYLYKRGIHERDLPYIEVRISDAEYKHFEKILSLMKKDCFTVEDFTVYIRKFDYCCIYVSLTSLHHFKLKRTVINLLKGNPPRIIDGGYFFKSFSKHISEKFKKDDIYYYLYLGKYHYVGEDDEWHYDGRFINLYYRIEL